MHIGLIGGIGVAATVSYYERLTKEVAGRGQKLELTIVHADVQTLIANNAANPRAEQAQIYAGLIDRLKAAGCDCASITSLGGHFCYGETVDRSSLPLVSGVSPLDTYFAHQGIQTVGLLGTRVVMATRLYGQLTQTTAVALDDRIEQLDNAYIDMAVAGTCDDARRAMFIEAGRQMVADQGAEAIVLAGTDLSLAFGGVTTDYPVIDALDVHVGVLADLATGRVALSEVADGT